MKEQHHEAKPPEQAINALTTFDTARWWSLLRYVLRQFQSDNCLTFAGMLTFNTLLALVPLITVVTMVLAALPVADELIVRFQDLIADYLVPEKQDTIQQTLFELAGNATKLSATMAGFLLLTSLMLMATVEKTLNQIWGVSTPRTLVNRFLIFWTALTTGPMLILGSLALSSYFFSMDILSSAPAVGWLAGLARQMGPVVALALAFFLLFAIVPNRAVPWRHALIGALATTVMFEVVKYGFGAYVRTFDGYDRVYDAISAVPIFILWIYLLWSVVLLGASFTASLGSFRYRSHGESYPAKREFQLLYRLLGHLWQAQVSGGGLLTEQLLRREPGADDHQIQHLLENLRLAQMVRRDEEGEWLLVRDLDQVTLGQLYATGAYVWPTLDDLREFDDDLWNHNLMSEFEKLSASFAAASNRNLKALYSGSGLSPVDSEPDRPRADAKNA